MAVTDVVILPSGDKTLPPHLQSMSRAEWLARSKCADQSKT
jgi:hypothetical protein